MADPASPPEPAPQPWRDRAFVLAWLAMLASTSGTFLLLLALSVTLFAETGSGFLAAAVFGVQWLLPLAAAPAIAWLAARFRPKHTLTATEVIAAGLSLAAGLALDLGVWPLMVLLALRGLAEATTKSVRIVALKRHTDPVRLERAASLFNTSQYLGGALGALVGAALVERLSIGWIAVIDAGTFLFAAACYALLPREVAPAPADGRRPTFRVFRAAGAILGADPGLARAFGYLLVIVVAFQGYHNVARTPLPMAELGLGGAGVMLLQVLASLAIVAGALTVAAVMQSGSVLARRLPLMLLVGLTAAAMIAAVGTPIPAVSLALYTLFIFGFEIAYTRAYKDMVVACPADGLPAVATLANTLQMAGMMLVVFAAGGLTDAIGLVAAGGIVAAAVAAAVIGLEGRTAGRAAPSAATVPPQAADAP